MAENEITAIVEFLCDGSSYGKSERKVERITTHAAEIFLVDQRAFKMKRAVRYSFLDFRELSARRRVLETELRLNRRTAPQLYHRVVPVCRRADGSLAVGGPGEPVEWLLEMTRFDQAGLLDRVAARGGLKESLIGRLAACIADFHRRADVRPDRGGYEGMAEVVRSNIEDRDSLVPDVLPAETVARLARGTCETLERHRDLLERRRAQGRVRHCHGDLHLGNIVLLDDEPVMFDCLEFDEGLACIDTLYDVAFLLMDLCERDLRPGGGAAADHLSGARSG